MNNETKPASLTIDLTNDIREIMQAVANYRANATRPDDMTETEFRIVSGIVRRALSKGYTVSVNDDAFGGGEWTIKNSHALDEIIGALATTGGDLLKIRDAEGRSLGVVSLIYGNGDDVVSDCSDTPAILELIA